MPFLPAAPSPARSVTCSSLTCDPVVADSTVDEPATAVGFAEVTSSSWSVTPWSSCALRAGFAAPLIVEGVL
jgi:hypothetical protein